MKFFLVVLLGMIAIINSKAIQEEDTVELNGSEEDSSNLVKRGTKFDISDYKGYKQGRRGWTGVGGDSEELAGENEY